MSEHGTIEPTLGAVGEPAVGTIGTWGGDYDGFLSRKAQMGADSGFDPLWVPDFLFPFQRALVEWSIRKGRAALFADCGLGKTPMQLVWADNVARHTGQRVLIVAPLAVCARSGATCANRLRHASLVTLAMDSRAYAWHRLLRRATRPSTAST